MFMRNATLTERFAPWLHWKWKRGTVGVVVDVDVDDDDDVVVVVVVVGGGDDDGAADVVPGELGTAMVVVDEMTRCLWMNL